MKRLIFIFSIFLSLQLAVTAQKPLSDEQKQLVIDSIVSSYVDWQTVEISGKVDMKGLPIKPSAKIYMERDSVVRISIRAPFLGEVARAEINPHEVLLINKMKQKYYRRSLDNLLDGIPVSLREVQALLLGRIFIVGMGELTAKDADIMELFPNDIEGYAVLPIYQPDDLDVYYGFQTDGFLRTDLALASTPDEEIFVVVEYQYVKNGYDIDVEANLHNKTYNLELQLKDLKFGAPEMKPFTPGRDYKQTSLKDVMKF